MGEALISRAGGGSEADVVIPVTPGYHTVLVTLKDYENKALNGFNLNCKDGSTYYNYSTNDKGQVLFTCNSGSANIFLPNGNYIDFQSSWTNVAAPIGLTSKVNINVKYTDINDKEVWLVKGKEVQDGYWKIAVLRKLTVISKKLDNVQISTNSKPVSTEKLSSTIHKVITESLDDDTEELKEELKETKTNTTKKQKNES